MAKILVLQNAELEGPGRFADEMTLAGDEFKVIHLYRNEKVPPKEDLRNWSGLLIMGGPQTIVPDKPDGFLKDELAFIKEGIAQHKPMIGICLGAQLIAKASGGRVWHGEKKEIGWAPVWRDEYVCGRSPLFGTVQNRFMALQWHGDSFDIPPEGYRMLYGEDYLNQVICYQGIQYGVQFHPEVTEEMLGTWFADYAPDASVLPPQQSSAQIMTQARTHLPYLHKVCHKIWYGFHSLLR